METEQITPLDSFVCHECKAKHIAYKFHLHSWLIDVLHKIAVQTQPAFLRELDLTNTQWTNAQKLSYWGFIEPLTMKGQRRHGYWFLTEKGRQFLNGSLRVNKIAVMRDNKLLRYEGPLVDSSLADYVVETRPDYQQQIREQI